MSRTGHRPDEPQSGASSPPLLKDLLRDVSRSFYLTLRMLPAKVRTQVGLAYLLARATDTIADTGVVPVAERLRHLEQWRRCIADPQGRETFQPSLAESASGSTAERQLLRRAGEMFGLLARLGPSDQGHIRRVLDIIISGQALDLERFGSASSQQVVALEDAVALDDYTYRVAGCVGEFWTNICREHLFPRAALDPVQLLSDGVRFGKGLQLVNILRDAAKDLRQGRCYFPRDELLGAGLEPRTLLVGEKAAPAFEPIYHRWRQRARDHLVCGWRYTVTLPRTQVRLRLACAWPVLIGLQTLNKLTPQNALDPVRRVKVSREELRGIILQTIYWYPWPGRWEQLGHRALGRMA